MNNVFAWSVSVHFLLNWKDYLTIRLLKSRKCLTLLRVRMWLYVGEISHGTFKFCIILLRLLFYSGMCCVIDGCSSWPGCVGYRNKGVCICLECESVSCKLGCCGAENEEKPEVCCTLYNGYSSCVAPYTVSYYSYAVSCSVLISCVFSISVASL